LFHVTTLPTVLLDKIHTCVRPSWPGAFPWGMACTYSPSRRDCNIREHTTGTSPDWSFLALLQGLAPVYHALGLVSTSSGDGLRYCTPT
jgi:hypothetical protein